MKKNPILKIQALGFQWQTQDPFLFCVHHEDHYPKGNAEMGPDASLSGRMIGSDFEVKDGWRMYHGSKVPGFPAHPHRGFETVTIVRKGLVDHSDSLGAAGRFGNGDVQWMTAGKGVQHSEMFPLLKQDEENPFELFQIWLNLPRAKKFVNAHFSMLWSEDIPQLIRKDKAGRATKISLIAGSMDGVNAPAPAPDSWAADPENEVAIWTITMDPHAEWLLAPSKHELNRSLYFFEGETVALDGQLVQAQHGIDLDSTQEILLKNGEKPGQFLLLQGKAIDEPVVHYGPFVMNSNQEIHETMLDYQKTEFGGWPWPSYDHVHPRERTRFARYADGREEVKNA